MDFIQSLSGNAVFMIFLTLVLGYALGRISFAGIEFGTSGVLIVALIFGALGMEGRLSSARRDWDSFWPAWDFRPGLPFSRI